MKEMLALAALSAALFVVPTLQQQAHAETIRQPVAYADLDLSDPADVATLDRRILTAAQAACGWASSADLEGKREVRRCREAAQASVATVRARVIASAGEQSPTSLASRD